MRPPPMLPIRPSSQRTSRITMIVQSIEILLSQSPLPHMRRRGATNGHHADCMPTAGGGGSADRVEKDGQRHDGEDDEQQDRGDEDARREDRPAAHAASVSISWSRCSAGLTWARTCSMRPSGPTMKVLRSLPNQVRPLAVFSIHT